jgi:hypothetical protein
MTNAPPETAVPTSLERAARKAVLPFRIVEELGVPCGYERSFKMLPGRVLANRYLLGIETKSITREQMLGICQRLGMPADYQEAFAAGLPDANLVFLGFEDDEERGCMYRLYLEFWDKRQRDLQASRARIDSGLLHLGFKWSTDDPAKKAVSKYVWHPLLTIEEVLQRLEYVYADQPNNVSHEAAGEILTLAASRSGRRSLRYLDVSEQQSQRRSFDINLYRAGLRIQDVHEHLSRVRQHYGIPDAQFRRLCSLTGQKLFGHLSGGTNREGQDFLTFYYEA